MARARELRTTVYARGWTLDQDPEMQLRELRAYAKHRGFPITDDFIDYVTGATAERRQLEEFGHLGVGFIWITEHLDTSSPIGKAIFTVISVITEGERSLISERVRVGIAKARANGTRHGRPRIDDRTVQEIQRPQRQGQSLHQIAKQLDISHHTVANYAPQRRHNTRCNS